MQKNWIGKSYGGEIEFAVKGREEKFRVFTTRADTTFGVTYVVLAPENPLVDVITTPECKAAVEEYKLNASKVTEIDRLASNREKTGVMTGAYAINPVNGREVPILVADYVLASYGTGAVMGVAAHDERDYVFAKKLGLPIERVVKSADGSPDELPYTDYGVMVNSGEFDGMSSEEGKIAVIKKLEAEGKGALKTNYRLRDWLVSRQRYWGAPIPMIHCEHCGVVPVPEEDLPVRLPYNVEFKPDGPARQERGVHERQVSRLRQTRAARPRHPGHLRVFELVLSALSGQPQRQGGVRPRVDRQDAARGQVYRRGGTRLHAPALRALLHQGAARYGLSRL